jgi:protein-S-isoprenylcysteine O-methyltransferase Ste14
MLKLRSPLGLSPTGVGPALMLIQLPLLAAAAIARLRWPESTQLPLPPNALSRVLGAGWIVAGVALWGRTLIGFLREFPRGWLIVDGPYRYCRHPLYASLFVFVLPGVSLLAHTWTILVAGLVGDALTWALVTREERELERTFGAEWRAYRARTSRLIPFPPSGRLRRSVAAVGWVMVATYLAYAAIGGPALQLMAASV